MSSRGRMGNKQTSFLLEESFHTISNGQDRERLRPADRWGEQSTAIHKAAGSLVSVCSRELGSNIYSKTARPKQSLPCRANYELASNVKNNVPRSSMSQTAQVAEYIFACILHVLALLLRWH